MDNEPLPDGQKPRQKASRWRRCLAMLACAYIHGMSMGTTIGLSVMYAELIAVFSATRSQVALIQSLYVGLLSGGGVLMSPIVRRYGPGPSIIAGSVVGALGLIAASFVTNLAVITFTVGIVTGIGLSVNYLSSTISVSWIFHDDPGSALAFLSIGSSLGQCIMPYVMEVFLELYQWNGAFLLLGGVAFQCVLSGCYIYTCRDFYKTDIDEKEMTFKESIKKIFDMSLLRDTAIVLFLIDVFFLALTGNMPGFFVDILSTRGQPRSKGSVLLSVSGLSILIGRVVGFLIRLKVRMKTVYHWVYLWPLVSLGFVLSITAQTYDWLMAAIVFCGVTFGAASSLRYTITLDVCGLARYPQAVALNNLLAGLGGFFAYTLGGIFKDLAGSYDPFFYLAAVAGLYMSITSAVVAVLLRRKDVKLAGDDVNYKMQYSRLPSP